MAEGLGRRLLVSVFLVKALGGDLRAPGADLQAAPATAVRRAGS